MRINLRVPTVFFLFGESVCDIFYVYSYVYFFFPYAYSVRVRVTKYPCEGVVVVTITYYFEARSTMAFRLSIPFVGN